MKSDWEKWKYDDEGRLIESVSYNSYEYDDRLLFPNTVKYVYNTDGTLKEQSENSLTSTTVYKFYYNSNKQLERKEMWGRSGVIDVETFLYGDGRLIESKGSSIIIYEYDANGNIKSEEYFKDENRLPWFKYVYERDSRGNETKKTQLNLDRNNSVILNEASYEYNSEGKVIKSSYVRGVLGKNYIVTYEYQSDGKLKSKQVQRRLLSTFDDWMYITLEYIYK